MDLVEGIDLDRIERNLREKKYQHIGSGSGRRVFDLENGFVVKVAKNKRGRAQNEAEFEIALTDDSNLFAKILEASYDFDLLIMEKAESIQDFKAILDYFHVRTAKEFFNLMVVDEILFKYDLLASDLSRVANWGTIHGQPVIIDYGFTKNVKRKYYSVF